MGEADVEALERGHAALNRRDQFVAVVRQTGAGRSSGARVETRLAHVWTVANGKAVRWEAVPEPEAVLDDGR